MSRKIYGNIDLADNQILNALFQNLASDPTGVESKFYYNSTAKEIRFHNGTTWIALGPAGAGGPPTGGASGDLTGSYPGPTIAADKVDNTKLANMAANSLKGNNTGSIADPVDLTVAQVKTLLAYTKSDVGLDQVDNTSDASKPVSTATSTALGLKADKTTAINAGNGLTGDGTLASAVTLAVGAGTGITVNANDIAVNRTVVDTWYLGFGGGTLTGFLTLHANPSTDFQAATKQYVDLTSQGFAFKNAVRVVTTSNITNVLTGAPNTVDSVSLAVGDRVLVAAQSTASQNGIYTVTTVGTGSNGVWARATDMDANGELKDGTLVPVAAGTVNADSQWMCTAIGADPWVAGTSTSTWTRYSGVSDVTAGAGLVRNGTALDIVANADNTITVNANDIQVNSTNVEITSRKGAVNGYAALDGTTKVPIAQLPTGTTGTTIALGNHTHAGYAATTTTITAGNGLTGGGDLSTNRTITALAADASINVAVGGLSVASAPKWTTSRTLTLGGDLTGSVSFDGGSAIPTLTATLAAGAGGKRYAQALAASTSQVITHNLNTQDVIVNVYNGSSPYEEVIVDVEHTTVNTITIKANPALPSGYRVVVLG